MASLHYEETLIVRKLPLERPQRRAHRAVTTQFAPTRPVRWPWLVGAALWIAGLVQPIHIDREVRLSSHAHEVLRGLNQ